MTNRPNLTCWSTVVLVLVATAAAADAPFGFSMGSTLSQLQEASDSAPKPVDSEPNLYLLTTAPKPHSAFEAYAVLVGPRSGLCQIRALGKDIRSSLWGERTHR